MDGSSKKTRDVIRRVFIQPQVMFLEEDARPLERFNVRLIGYNNVFEGMNQGQTPSVTAVGDDHGDQGHTPVAQPNPAGFGNCTGTIYGTTSKTPPVQRGDWEQKRFLGGLSSTRHQDCRNEKQLRTADHLLIMYRLMIRFGIRIC